MWLPGRIGAGAHVGRGALGYGVVVQAHIAEVGAEPALHLGAYAGIERAAGTAQHLLYGGALHRLSGAHRQQPRHRGVAR